MSSSGSNAVTGTSGNDNLNGGSGDDVLDGGAGSDKISAGSGNDTLDGGSGSDSLNGGSGNDTLVYNVTENGAAGTRDVYTGGSGVDTVVVEFTLAQWLSASTQTQIQQYLSHLAAYTNAKTGEVSNGSASDFTFTFGGSTLTVQMMEQLKVFVDGIELNPADQAVLALNDAATLGEDAAGVVIDVLDNDFVPDLVGNLQVASQPAHGTVAVLDNGAPGDPSQWTLKYTPDAGAWNHLAQGETATETFTYEVTDADGDVATATVTLTVTGMNDAVLITSAAQAGAVVEDAQDTASPSDAVAASGTISFSDADLSDGHGASFAAAASNTTALGAFALAPVDEAAHAANGTVDWSYALNSAAAQALAEGEVVVEKYDVTVSDGHGGQATQTVTITITGTNDKPVAMGDTGAANEDSAITGSVAANDGDVDHGAVLSYALVEPVAGLSLQADGSYSFDAGHAAYQHLSQGATETVVVNYTVTDEHGASSTSALTIMLTGTNDVPVAVADTGSASEDTVITGSVAGNDSDVDDGAILIYTLNDPIDGLTLNADGSYSFDAGNAAYQHLAEGATATVVANYTVTDQHGASSTSSLTITLTGTNDVPVAVADIGSATEDSVITGSVATNDGDVDDGAVLGYTLNDPVDGLTLNADGTYSFDAGNASYQHLAQGATATVVANYTVTDQHGASSTSTLTITLTGTNDVPVAVVDTNSASEDTVITGSVGTNDSDADDGAVLSYALNAPVDGLTLNADGIYSFDAGNAAYQHLAQGATATVVANYTVTDQHGASNTSTLTITLTGTNDVPVAVADTGSATEDAIITGSVAANDSDVDDGAVLSYALSAPLDGLTLNADGSYSFDAGNAAYQHLAQGATATVVANYTVTDQHGASSSSSLTITLTGTNDAPVAFADINGADAVIEAGVHPGDTPFAGDPVASGNLLANDTDVDASDTKVVTTTGTFVGTYGSVIIAADGSWTYTLNDADPDTNALAQGQAATDVFAYTMQDGTGATSSSTLTIDLTGTNDAPVAADDTASGDEDTPITTGNVLANDGDIDGSLTAASISAYTQGVHGSVVHNGDGSFTYNADANFNGSDSFSYTVTDAYGATSTAVVNLTVGAVNDAPVAFIAAASYAATEQVALNLKDSGLSVGDVDAGAGAVTVTLSVGEGTLSVAAGNSGATVSGSGTGSVTITGTLAQINALLNTDATSAVSYVNGADAPSASTTLTLSVNDNGNAGSGGVLVATDSATITITAVNDAPVNTVPGAQTTAEDAPKSITGLAVSDADAGSGSLVTTLSVAHGNLSLATVSGGAAIAGNGTSSVTLTGTQAAINLTLAAAALYTPTPNFHGSDTLTMSTTEGGNSGTGGALGDSDTVAITVTPVNDNPGPVADRVIVSSSTAVTISTSALLANDIDIDGASLSITAVSGAVGITGLTLNADGTVSFTSGNTVGVNAGSFTYTASDGAGGTTTGTVSIEVRGVSSGNGADTVDLTGASYDASYIDGRGGADNVTGDSEGDVFLGGSGNGADTLKGSDGNDLLVGGDGNDSLAGGAGNDVLRGGIGNGDTMDGGAGAEDLLDFSDGTIGMSFTLVQSASLTPIANGTAGLGNNDGYANIEGVIGTRFNDSITGSGGNDILRGGTGNDTLDGAGGNDLIDFSDASAGISFALIQGATNSTFAAPGLGSDTYRNFEGVIGTGFADSISGTSGADTLRGGGGNDTIVGGGGDDRIGGGNGADLLTGGAGIDTFVFDTAPNAVDTISDFDANAVDKIELSQGVFGALGAGSLGAADFATVDGTGASADGGSAHVIYDSATGNVYYDADGGSAAGCTLFANLSGVAGTFDHNDISVAP